MKKVFRGILKVAGYIIGAIYTVNLLISLVSYSIRHDGWYFIYNPNFGRLSNSDLAWQIVISFIFIMLAWGLITVSKKMQGSK